MEYEISFNVIERIDDDIEWKLIYVGSPKNKEYDQTLESLLVGPLEQGTNCFIFKVFFD